MQSPFARAVLPMLAGPLIWAVHFLFIYTVNGIACARPGPGRAWMGVAMSSWIIVASSLLALLAMTLIYRHQRSRMPRAGNPEFLPWLAAALSLLSAVAIVWETVPVLMLPPCM